MKQIDADIAVVGAGIVGICSALALQDAGYKVALIDKNGIARKCSQGNAGHFASEQVLPLATPGLLWKIPGMLLDPLGPVAIRSRYLPHIAPWLVRFMLNTRDRPFSEGSAALSNLNGLALSAWQRLLTRTGAHDQLKMDGSLLVFEQQNSFSAYQPTLHLLAKHGVVSQTLSAGEVHEIEPQLNSSVLHGVLFPETGHTANPFRLATTLADYFIANGGRFIQQDVSDMQQSDGQVVFKLEGELHRVKQLVLATGAWSKKWVKQLTGLNIPLDTERGYHLMLPNAGQALTVPVTSAERRFIMTPMEEGLRLGGTVEFGGLEAKANMQRAEMLAQHAKILLPEQDHQIGETWMGHRPSLPDSLPVMERVGSHKQVYLNFGHQHLGLTQAAICAELMVSELQSTANVIDLAPFRSARF